MLEKKAEISNLGICLTKLEELGIKLKENRRQKNNKISRN